MSRNRPSPPSEKKYTHFHNDANDQRTHTRRDQKAKRYEYRLNLRVWES